MPNWVENRVSIFNTDKETAEKIKKQLARPIKVIETDYSTDKRSAKIVTPVMSFLNIVCPPADKWEEYHEPKASKRGENGEMIQTGEGEYGWYQFNNREWGTKWDCTATLEEQITEYGVTLIYSFDTAWSPPIPAIEKLSKQYPDVEIELWWCEEQGFGAEHTFNDGNMETVYEWDTPSTHDQAIEAWGYCACSDREPDDLPYDDCAVRI